MASPGSVSPWTLTVGARDLRRSLAIIQNLETLAADCDVVRAAASDNLDSARVQLYEEYSARFRALGRKILDRACAFMAKDLKVVVACMGCSVLTRVAQSFADEKNECQRSESLALVRLGLWFNIAHNLRIKSIRFIGIFLTFCTLNNLMCKQFPRHQLHI